MSFCCALASNSHIYKGSSCIMKAAYTQSSSSVDKRAFLDKPWNRRTGMTYDVCIVGAGMWGSTAARHASTQPGLKICIVGPEEPTPEEFANCDIFGAHYDAGRIYTSGHGNGHVGRTRGLLSHRSIARFADLEKQSGIKFYKEVGYIHFGDVEASCDSFPDGVLLETAAGIQTRYPYLDVARDGPTAILSKHGAGYIDPRKYVRAQLFVARRQGCDIISDVVARVTKAAQSGGEGHGHVPMLVKTESGRQITARKVLLCTGAFTLYKELLPVGCRLDVEVTSDVTVRFELDDEGVQRLRDMPCMTSEFNEPSTRECYILPPITYPDGKVYIKIGHGRCVETTLRTHDELRRWYVEKADPKVVNTLKEIFHSVVKGAKPLAEIHCTCADLDTPTGLPYCDMVSPGLGVLVGGNSQGATIAEEMGRMGADMIIGKTNWNLDIPKDVFKVKFVTD